MILIFSVSKSQNCNEEEKNYVSQGDEVALRGARSERSTQTVLQSSEHRNKW